MRQHFRTTQEALDFLREDQFRRDDNEGHRFLFRGERREYPFTTSLLRQSGDVRSSHEKILLDLTWHLMVDYFEGRLVISDEAIYLDGEPLDILKAVEAVNGTGVGSSAAMMIFAPIFQHYGWPSFCLDVSYDPEVALFFASYDFGAEEFEHEGIGYLYYWDPLELLQAAPFLWLVDLRHLVEPLHILLGLEASRPHRQAGASMMLGQFGTDENDLNLVAAKDTRRLITFDRGDAEDVLPGKDFYFPNDGLYDFLNTHEAVYFSAYAELKILDQTTSKILGDRQRDFCSEIGGRDLNGTTIYELEAWYRSLQETISSDRK